MLVGDALMTSAHLHRLRTLPNYRSSGRGILPGLFGGAALQQGVEEDVHDRGQELVLIGSCGSLGDRHRLLQLGWARTGSVGSRGVSGDQGGGHGIRDSGLSGRVRGRFHTFHVRGELRRRAVRTPEVGLPPASVLMARCPNGVGWVGGARMVVEVVGPDEGPVEDAGEGPL